MHQVASCRLWLRLRLLQRHTALLSWREFVQLRASPIEPALKLLMFVWAGIVVGGLRACVST